ncbi:MAG: hypothetical protein QCH35_05080 [Methanomicrobiaceae archaeon]|nr:hypothetical protein [Methanomicrobiaceae archaeon]
MPQGAGAAEPRATREEHSFALHLFGKPDGETVAARKGFRDRASPRGLAVTHRYVPGGLLYLDGATSGHSSDLYSRSPRSSAG